MPSKIAAAGKEVVLTYTFNNTRPIELLALTASLFAIGDQYRRFAEDHFETGTDDYRLYVREARPGSIVIDLITYATQPQILAPLAPILLQYTSDLSDWFDFFKGVKDAKDIDATLGGGHSAFDPVTVIRSKSIDEWRRPVVARMKTAGGNGTAVWKGLAQAWVRAGGKANAN